LQCCSVLQCVAVCCSLLQFVAVCCSVLNDSAGDLLCTCFMHHEREYTVVRAPSKKKIFGSSL